MKKKRNEKKRDNDVDKTVLEVSDVHCTEQSDIMSVPCNFSDFEIHLVITKLTIIGSILFVSTHMIIVYMQNLHIIVGKSWIQMMRMIFLLNE